LRLKRPAILLVYNDINGRFLYCKVVCQTNGQEFELATGIRRCNCNL
jgi:hypothetical protein